MRKLFANLLGIVALLTFPLKGAVSGAGRRRRRPTRAAQIADAVVNNVPGGVRGAARRFAQSVRAVGARAVGSRARTREGRRQLRTANLGIAASDARRRVAAVGRGFIARDTARLQRRGLSAADARRAAIARNASGIRAQLRQRQAGNANGRGTRAGTPLATAAGSGS